MKNILDSHITIYEGHNQYDYDNMIMLNWYPFRIIELLKEGRSILELGIGHGFTTEIFSKHFKRHVVLEGSYEVIENFNRKFPLCKPDIIETFFEKFESSEKFDVIVMGFVLEHVDDPLRIITHFKKFLTSKGRIVITVPNAEALNRRLGYFAGLLPDMQQLSDNDILSGHKRYYTVSSLTKEIKSVGYEIEIIEGLYLKPFTTKQMMSLEFDKKINDALCVVGKDYPELSLGILVILK